MSSKLTKISASKTRKARATHLRSLLIEHGEPVLLHKLSLATGNIDLSPLNRVHFDQQAFEQVWNLLEGVLQSAGDTIPLNWGKGSDTQITDTLAALGRGDITAQEAKDLIGAVSAGSDTVELKQLAEAMADLTNSR